MEVAIDRIVMTKDVIGKNYKIATDIGLATMTHSLDKYGRAGALTVNPADYKKLKTCKLHLIDGNSRYEDAVKEKEKKILVTYPERQLSRAEYKEMSAMLDKARAGEVDDESIHKDFGTTKQWFDSWGLKVPLDLLKNIGRSERSEEMEEANAAKGGKKSKKASATVGQNDVIEISLIMKLKEEESFRALEEKVAAKLKTNNTTDTVWAAFKHIIKK